MRLKPENEMTFDDLRCCFRSGQSICTGTDAHRRKTHSYRYGVVTKLGDFEKGEWARLMESLIRRSGETDLFNSLLEWEREHNYTRMSEPALRLEVLEQHSMRIFDCEEWVYYLPFNRRYRPEVIDESHVVRVVCNCCKEPGDVTKKQIKNSYHHMIACPICGRYDKYRIVKNGVEKK